LALSLLAILSVPTLHQHWEDYHPLKWRQIHFALSIVAIAALGFVFFKKDLTIKILYSCTIFLISMEAAIGLKRCTTHAVQMHIKSPILIIGNTCRLSNGAGCFYWVHGLPMLAAQSGSDHLLLIPRELTKSFGEAETIIIEGPFGPNIGIYSWLCHYVSKLLERKFFHQKILSLDTIRDLLRRPVQLPKGEKICFFVDSSAIFRSQSLWHYFNISPIEVNKQVNVYLLGTTPDEILKELFPALFCSSCSSRSPRSYCSSCPNTKVYSFDKIMEMEFRNICSSAVVSKYYK
jgi:hypothetical protein